MITLSEPADVLYRIQRGLAGYVSYLAACEMNESFSEYVLYEPILRILTARGFRTRSEVACPGIAQSRRGDRKRLDFVAESSTANFALEVKWQRRRALNVSTDLAKLTAYLRAMPDSRAFLCVFGRISVVGHAAVRPPEVREVGTLVIADFRKTRYCCRIFEAGIV